MLKKTISIVMTMIILSFFGIKVFASDVMPCDLYTASCSSTLTISDTTATCISKATGYSGETTKIVISQTLQKKGIFGTWGKVINWDETDSGYIGSATNTQSGLTSGTYRLKTVFTVYAGSDYETITKYSLEKTI